MSKLLKYNIKNFSFPHLIAGLVIIINSFIVKLLNYITSNVDMNENIRLFLSRISGVVMSVAIFIIATLPILTIIMIVRRYKTNVLDKQSYLTHTLPVTKKDILFATFFNIIIFFIYDAVIITIGALILVGYDNLVSFISVFDVFTRIDLFLLAIMALVYFIVFNFQLMLALTFGYSRPVNKITNTIIAAVIIYFVNQFINIVFLGGSMIIFMLVDTNMRLTLLMVVAILYYGGLFAVTYSIMVNSLRNNLNLE